MAYGMRIRGGSRLIASPDFYRDVGQVAHEEIGFRPRRDLRAQLWMEYT
jgi:hypothetical protein